VQSYDAVIVGGGIGGLALGCGLANNGRSVLILEARSGISPSQRGLTLQPNGLEALQKLGLLERTIRIGTRSDIVAWYEIAGGLLANLDYSLLEHPQNYLLTVVPSELEQVLRHEFSRKNGVIHESASFEGFKLCKDHIQVKSRGDGSTAECSTKILVGADGADSRVRTALHVKTQTRECPDHFLFMLVGPVEPLRQEARQYLSRGKMAGFFPVPEGTYIFYYLPRGKLNDLKAEGLDSFKNELQRIMPELAGSLNNLQSWDDITYAAPRRIKVQSWVGERVAIIGDAAHALDPSWAQGANMTLQDAIILGDTIEGCFQSDDFSSERLKTYENARRKQTTFIQKQADRTAQLTTTENRFNSWLGKRVLKKTGTNRRLMRIALNASCGLTDHFTIGEQLRFLV